MNKPLVSVLMTVYNAEPFIAKAIQSVLEQTYANWELLILDDVSSDNTREVIDSFTDKRIKRIYNPKNIGYVASKNVLLKQFAGEYACFLDADDWMAKERLEVQLAQFFIHNGLGACMCNYWRVQPDGTCVKMDFYPSSRFIVTANEEMVFAGAGIMFSRTVVESVGGFEPYFDRLLGDDSYWAFRVAEKFPFYYLNQALYYYRANENSITASFNNMRKLTIVCLLKELKEQRLKSGTDWLEVKQYDKALAYEQALIRDKKWLAEKYRQAAAVRLDYKDKRSAKAFLIKSFKNNPFSLNFYRTLIYYFKYNRVLSENNISA
ncbi:glycosyltransferase family 2 protein [Flavisolibacter nicotianae]|uniref:glycosyltransferase family 2 protein n=1 Tax=Flavisolibacter nicotianae TaxID=2364882 RepID=UPI000EAF11D5|nr:glycosyltransferase family A protein [Flavisolibacter nicotianae]